MIFLPEDKRIMNLLSMAQRAGKVVSGSFASEEAMKGKKAKHILIAKDASEESKHTFSELAGKHRVSFSFCLTKALLGKCLGKEYRAVAVLLDEGFSNSLKKLIEKGGI